MRWVVFIVWMVASASAAPDTQRRRLMSRNFETHRGLGKGTDRTTKLHLPKNILSVRRLQKGKGKTLPPVRTSPAPIQPSSSSPTTSNPSAKPTNNPTKNPTKNPLTSSPTRRPTSTPTQNPSSNPTRNPSLNPTRQQRPTWRTRRPAKKKDKQRRRKRRRKRRKRRGGKKDGKRRRNRRRSSKRKPNKRGKGHSAEKMKQSPLAPPQLKPNRATHTSSANNTQNSQHASKSNVFAVSAWKPVAGIAGLGVVAIIFMVINFVWTRTKSDDDVLVEIESISEGIGEEEIHARW